MPISELFKKCVYERKTVGHSERTENELMIII